MIVLSLSVLFFLPKPLNPSRPFLIGTPFQIEQNCQKAIDPVIALPEFGIFEGSPHSILVCGVDPTHTYQLWENKFDTFFRTFTGQTSYKFIISWIESDFHADTTLGIELWDNTTKEVLDQKLLVLIQIDI